MLLPSPYSIAQGSKAAKPAQAILEEHGISVHNAANGARVPGGAHAGMHTGSYYGQINARIRAASAGGRQAILAELRKIGQEIEEATRKIEKTCDDNHCAPVAGPK